MRQLSFFAGTAFALALVVHCGGLGDMSKADAGSSGSGGDAGSSGSGGQGMVIQATCDKTATRVDTSTSSTQQTQTTTSLYFAEISVPGLQPSDAPHISAVMCDHVQTKNGDQTIPDPIFNSECKNSSMDGGISQSCTISGYAIDGISCDQTSWKISPGKLIVHCGNASDFVFTTNYPGSPPSTTHTSSSDIHKTVYVRVN